MGIQRRSDAFDAARFRTPPSWRYCGSSTSPSTLTPCSVYQLAFAPRSVCRSRSITATFPTTSWRLGCNVAGGSRSTCFGKGLSFARATSRSKLAPPDPEEIEYLHLSANAPVLIRNLRYCDVSGRHVMAGHTVHRGDLVRYSLQVPLAREGAPAEDTVGCGGVHDD